MHLRCLLAAAVALWFAAALPGCGGGSLGPARLFPASPIQPVTAPRTALAVGEALDLAWRQTGLRWAAVADVMQPPGGTSVGPFELGQEVPLNRFLDAIAAAAGTEWQWRRQMAVFGPRDSAGRIAGLARTLKSGSQAERRRAAAELADGQWPDAAVPLFEAAFGDSDPAVRWAALMALHRLESGCVAWQPVSRVPVTAVMLGDAVRDVKLPLNANVPTLQAAVIAAGAARARAAADQIVDALKLLPPEHLAAAAWALGQLEAAGQTDPLQDILEDASLDDTLRAAAAHALGRMRSTSAVSALRSATYMDEPVGASLAACGLGQCEDDATVDRLEQMVTDDRPEVALASAAALGRVGSVSACRALGRLLTHRRVEVRRLAAEGLGQTCRAIARELLLAAAGEEKDASVRAAIADALGILGGAPARDRLTDMAQDAAGGVRAAALAGLARIGGSEEALFRWLNDTQLSVEIKMAIVLGLGWSRSPAAVPLLTSVASTQPVDRLRAQACVSLARIAAASADGELLAIARRYRRSLPISTRALGWSRPGIGVMDLTMTMGQGGGLEQLYAAAALGDLRSGDALHAILAQGQLKNPEANRALFDAAVGSRAPDAPARIADFIANGGAASRVLAAVAAGDRIGDPRVADALQRLVKFGSPRERKLAMSALRASGDPAAATMVRGEENGPTSAGPDALSRQAANTWLLRNRARGIDDLSHPSAGYEASLFYDPRLRRIVQVGGYGRRIDSPPAGEVWTYDVADAAWQRVDLSDPPPATGAARDAVWAGAANAGVHVRCADGGRGWQFARHVALRRSVPWLLDAGGAVWSAPMPEPNPGPRGWSQCVYDADRDVVILFSGLLGGSSDVGEDLWIYDVAANRWARIKQQGAVPGPRGGAACAWDPVRRRMIMFGGQHGRPDKVTWAFDPVTATWTDLQAKGSPPRFVGPMVYDTIHGVFIALADRLDGPRVYVYHPDDNQWEAMPEALPRPRYGVIDAAFDPANNVVVITGGLTDWQTGAPTTRETWAYRYAAAPQPREVSIGRPLNLRVSALSDRTVKLTWDPPAEGSADGYRVLRGSGEDVWSATFEQVGGGLIEDREWTDSTRLPGGAGQGKRFYRVVAVDGEGRAGPPSAIARSQPALPGTPIVSLVAPGRVELNWSRAAGDDVAGYHVYRAKPNGVSPWDDDFLAKGFNNWTRVTNRPLDEPAFTETLEDLKGVASSESPLPIYGYMVKAVNRSGIESGPSGIGLTLAAGPTSVRAVERYDGSVMISWQPSRSRGLAGYFVYRMDSYGGGDAIRCNGTPILSGAWIDRPTDPRGCRRRYYVVPVDASGQLGIPSAGAWSHGRP